MTIINIHCSGDIWVSPHQQQITLPASFVRISSLSMIQVSIKVGQLFLELTWAAAAAVSDLCSNDVLNCVARVRGQVGGWISLGTLKKISFHSFFLSLSASLSFSLSASFSASLSFSLSLSLCLSLSLFLSLCYILLLFLCSYHYLNFFLHLSQSRHSCSLFSPPCSLFSSLFLCTSFDLSSFVSFFLS